MKILVTGFEPFGEVAENPSQRVVEQIAERHPALDLVAVVLPTRYGESARRIRALIEAESPDAIICLGVAQKRTAINLERVALNLDDAPAADNGGDRATGRVIADDAPLAYRSTLPLEQMLMALTARDIPAVISNHAGTYVCNHVFFAARHALERRGLATPCGFIHLPALRVGEDNDNGLPLAVMLDAIDACLVVLVGESVAARSSKPLATKPNPAKAG